MAERYSVQAFDANGQLLDTDPLGRGEGYPTELDGTSAVVDHFKTVRSGILHDWDCGAHKRKRIAYFVIWVINSLGYACCEIQVTPWGRKCRVDGKDLRAMHGVRNGAPILYVS